MKKFNAIVGMPRAGSTLLCQLLNMNARFHATPTSAILDSIKVLRTNWSHDVTWKAQNRIQLQKQFTNGIKAFLHAFYENNEIVFDKNRSWTGNIALLDEILGNNDSKFIFCYRDPVEIVGSIEAQYKKTIILENADEQAMPMGFISLDKRIGNVIGDGGLIWHPIDLLRDAIESGYMSRILFVKYYDLTTNTQEVLNIIHDFIEEPRMEYDLKSLKQSTQEFDGFYNYKFLHTIREGEVLYKESDVELPEKYKKIINNRFIGLNKLIFEHNPDILLGVSEDELKSENQVLILNKK